MQINLDTSTASPAELTALIALLASLGGRLPNARPDYVPNRGDRPETRSVPRELIDVHTAVSPEAVSEVLAESLPSERLMDAAVAAAQPADDAGDGTDPKSLDADGIPWDDRIHSTPPKRNGDDTWRKKRKVDEVLYGQIHAELQERYATTTGTASDGAAPTPSDTAPTTVAPPPPATEPAAPPPPADTGNAPAAASAPTADAPAAPAPAESAQVGAAKFANFGAFVQAVSTIRPQAIPYLELNGHANSLGVAAFKDMKDHPDLWETFYAMAGGQ